MRFILSVLACAALAAGVAGCNSLQPGPPRPISIDDDVARARAFADPDWTAFYSMDPGSQAVMRNQILTARMYIADIEYHYYESRLTRDMQEEGFAATMASLALTTSATLIPVTQTKTLLSGIATGVTGADKAVTEKILLSNTIQALQTQMRIDRKTEAGVIYAKMFKTNGTVTPIYEYTLAMALSDVDAYYQAGTISSALIGLSKTVTNAETKADDAKSAAGPNAAAVAAVNDIAAPKAPPTARQAAIIRNVNVPMQRFPTITPIVGPTRLSTYESQFMLPGDFRLVLNALCQPTTDTDLGEKDSPARQALVKFLQDNGKQSNGILDRNAFRNVQKLVKAGKRAC